MVDPKSRSPAEQPLLSIVIPVYNRCVTIGAALHSIAADGRRDVEIIVVDDGSEDGSAEAAEAAIAAAGLGDIARVARQDNAGPGAARNVGARLARGWYLSFFDSDDRWFPWTLDTCFEVLAKHPDAQLYFLQSVEFHRDTGPGQPERSALTTECYGRFLDAIEAVWTITYASCNVIIRRDLFDRLGGFTHDVRCGEDTDLFLHADPAGPCVLVTAPVMLGREVGQPGSLTGDVACVVQGLDYLIAKELGDRYPGGAGRDSKRTLLLAGAVISTVRFCFAAGYPGLAYARLLRYAGFLYRSRRGRLFLRLLLTPILSYFRPQHYRFRFRPL